jgi:hypothetical protein
MAGGRVGEVKKVAPGMETDVHCDRMMTKAPTTRYL